MRCELKLAPRRLPVLTRLPPYAKFSTATRRHDADEEDPQIQTQRPRDRLSSHPLGRIRRRKGKAAIRETTARLGVKTLGDDAEILVLEEVGDAPPEESITPEPVSTNQKVPDIIASLQQEDRSLTPEEINTQLESLRPKTQAEPDEPHYVNQSTFIKLARILLQGFTAQQLSHYYSVTKGVQRDHVHKEVLEGLKGLKGLKSTAKRPIERTDWHPGTTAINRRLPGLDVTHRPKRKPVSKQLLVDQILRDVWKLVLLEEIEAPGEIELSLKPWQLTLLSSGTTPTPLDRIGRDRKAKFEIHWPHNALRITADKTSAEYAADDVEQLLQDTEKKRFSLKPWIPYLQKCIASGELTSLFPQNNLQIVAAMTGASVQVVSGDALIIRGLHKNSVEEAERCLIRMLPLTDSVTYTVDTSTRDDSGGESYLLPAACEKESLDFLSRDLQLGRWSLPVMRLRTAQSAYEEEAATAHVEDAESPQANTIQKLDIVRERVLEMVRKSRKSISGTSPEELRKRKTGEWAVQPENILSAEFGHVLFPLDNSVPNSMSGPDSPGSLKPPFLHALPGLSRLLTDDTFRLTNHSNPPALEYDFVPAPEQQNFKAGQEYPTLHIQFRHDHAGMPSLRKLSLGFDERVHDVLLPDKAVDVRFARFARLRLHSPLADKKIDAFVKAVIDNIQSGERLTAPTLEVDIPKWTIPGYPHRNTQGTRTVKYLFTGIRFHQSVVGNLLGADISYRTVQSGKLGRKGGLLSAHYNSNSQGKNRGDAQLKDEARLNEFIKRCFAIADRITDAAANDKPVLQVLKPRDPMSARKLRRQSYQTGVANKVDGVIAEDTVTTSQTDQTNSHEVGDAESAVQLSTDTPPVNSMADDGHFISKEKSFSAPSGTNVAITEVERTPNTSRGPSAHFDPSDAEDSPSEVHKDTSIFTHRNDHEEPPTSELDRILKSTA